MTTSHRARRRARARLGALAVALALIASACHITWSAGTTHGAIIETTAGRASVGIWRAPTRLLADLERSKGIDLVQDVLCASGRFPAVTLKVGDTSITADVLGARWCGYVRGDDADLRGALRDSQAGGRDDCLALTLVSRGAYLKNWTHKDVGCRTGSLG